MKAALIAGLAVLAGAVPTLASAATIQGTATHDGTQWVITWNDVSPACATDFFAVSYAILGARVDGTSYFVTQDGIAIDAANDVNSVTLPALVPAGTLESFTINGATSFPCDGHTFLMPPAPAPVPTMSEWAMILLGMMMGGGAALVLQRRMTKA